MRQIDRFVAGVDAHPVSALLAAVTVLILLGGVAVCLRRVSRIVRRQGITAEQIGTVMAAAIATGVSAQGMWVFFEESLRLTLSLRIMFFAFLEIMVVTSALRARAAQQHSGSAGVDGVAMWVLTCLSAVLAATDAGNLGTLLIRLSAPLVAAWGWERSMALERRRAGHLRTINWRITPERVLIRLGLADPTDRTASEVATQRRLVEVALAHDRVRALRDSGAREWRIRLARHRLQKVMRAAVEEGGLVTASGQRAVLLDTIGMLSSTSALLDMEMPNPWQPTETHSGSRAFDTPTPVSTDVAAELIQPESRAGSPASAESEAPDTETFETEVPDTEVLETDVPDTEATDIEVPNTKSPNTETPDTKAPGPEQNDPTPARQRRRDPAMRERVRELHAANTPPTEIATRLDTSRRTVGRIIADLETERRNKLPGVLAGTDIPPNPVPQNEGRTLATSRNGSH
ncbi:hypothetical protein [Nocardia sp. NPDC051570]|uniref:hypothetical protein n=1 Tax=Nocardia sp. NPDC051570 TaxID=3364324 RepID=UPI0037980B96